MASGRFKITLQGEDADDSIRLSDLIDQLNAVKQTLNQIDMSLAGGKTPGLYYKVTKITMNSPATFEVEAVPKGREGASLGRRVVTKFQRDLKSVIAGKRPKDTDLDLLESYRGLVQPMRRHVRQVALQFDDAPMDIPRNLDVKVDDILGPDQVEQGSIVGSLDVLDVHNQRNLFKVYPVVGPRSIKCQFDAALMAQAIAGINHFVRISGLLHYKKAEKFPHLINVSSIEVLPEKTDRPTLSSMRGVAPEAFGGLSSTEYVDRVRNGDW